MARRFSLEIPSKLTEEEYRRILNERMLAIQEELHRLGQPVPLAITEDLDLKGHRLVNLGDPDKVLVKGKAQKVTADAYGETRQLEHALNVQFADARYLRKRRADEEDFSMAAGAVIVTLYGVHEDDIGLVATLQQPLGSEDPAVVAVSLSNESHLGDSFAAGNYLAINDPSVSSSRYNYEFVQLADLISASQWRLTRALLGSLVGEHSAGLQIYKLQADEFPFALRPGLRVTGEPTFGVRLLQNGVVAIEDLAVEGIEAGDLAKHYLCDPYSHRCVVAAKVEVFTAQGTSQSTTLSLIPAVSSDPACPGLRTHSGASYTLLRSGTLAVGSRMRVPIHVAEWSAFRSIYGYLSAAPVGSSDYQGAASAAVIDVAFVAPPSSGTADTDRLASVIERLRWESAFNYSYTLGTNPDARQMPYGKFGTEKAWPTTLLSGLATIDALVADGAATGTGTQLWRPNGYLDFIVRKLGDTVPGSGLNIEALL